MTVYGLSAGPSAEAEGRCDRATGLRVPDVDVVVNDGRVVAGGRGQPQPEVDQRVDQAEAEAAFGCAWNGERVVDVHVVEERDPSGTEFDAADRAGDRRVRRRRTRRPG